MPNDQVGEAGEAWEFHQATKLGYINLKTKPGLYKSYSGLPQVPLPAELAPPGMPALEAVAASGILPDGEVDIHSLGQLLHYSAGLIRRSNLPLAGEVHYRAAASAGALYPVELYVVCGDLPGLPAGVYHFAPDQASLVRLRTGDYRRNLAEAAANEETVARAPATIVCTAVFWRSAWKYRTRGYRYCFWDNGTILANIMAVSNSLGLPSGVVAGFADSQVDGLLGIDSEREASTCLIPLGRGPEAPAGVPELPSLVQGDLGDEHLVTYPESHRLQQASCLADGPSVLAWRGSLGPSAEPPLDAGLPESEPLGSVIAQRGSTRRFSREPIAPEQLSAILAASTRPYSTDYRSPTGHSGLIDTYLIVNAVQDLEAGAYFYGESGLELLTAGGFREEAGHLCFEQALGADASAVAFFMTDLEAVLGRLGNRGYRLAQLEAGVIGGRMYLASHGMGLGATGMTFFDDAVTAFFSPHAAGKSLMFLVGLGNTASPNRVTPFRSRIGMLKDSLARGAGGGRRPVPGWLYD